MEKSLLMSEIHYAQFQDIAETNIRITENSDTRITEQDDIRISNDIINNAAESSLLASATLIPFTQSPYYNLNGTWKEIINIYVKYNGSWIEPEEIYKKVNNTWKRVN